MIYALAFSQIVLLVMVVALVRSARLQQAALAQLEALAFGTPPPTHDRPAASSPPADSDAAPPAPGYWPVNRPFFFRPDDSKPGGVYFPEHLEDIHDEIAAEIAAAVRARAEEADEQ